MSLARNGAVLLAAMMIGNISNYLFQFYMGRHLAVHDYGAMNAVFSATLVIGIPIGTIMLVLARYTAAYNASGEEGGIALLYRNSLLKLGAFGLLALAGFVVFGTHLSRFLRLADSVPVILTGFAALFSFLLTVNLGLLQGLKRFYLLGGAFALLGLFKLLFGVLFVSVGFGLNGAVASYALSTTAVFVITTVPLSGLLARAGEGAPGRTRGIIRYSIPVFISSLFFAAFTNMDIILVKHYFQPAEAGMYAALGVLARTVLYMPAAIVLALFPMVSEAHAVRENTTGHLSRGLVYTAIVSFSGVALFTLFPQAVIRLLYGDVFVSVSHLLKFYGIAMASLALVNILMNYNLARSRTAFLYPMGAGCATLLFMMVLFHRSFIEIFVEMIGVGFAVFSAIIFLLYRERRVAYVVVNGEGIRLAETEIKEAAVRDG